MAEIKTQTLGSYLRLIEISRDLASTLDLDTLLDDIVRASADITHAEAASILLYDDTARQLYFQVATNIDEPTMRGLVIPLTSGVVRDKSAFARNPVSLDLLVIRISLICCNERFCFSPWIFARMVEVSSQTGFCRTAGLKVAQPDMNTRNKEKPRIVDVFIL